jgi:hypothetical protein
MLPGLRFLFAAILLSMSILVFGLGAAALLRAAHEEFASNPSWHATPETMFAQQADAARPVLAMLRVDVAPAAESQTSNNVPPAAEQAAAEQAAVAATPAKGIAALKPEDSPLPEAAKPEIPVEVASAQSDAAPAPANAPASADETKIAAVLSPANETAPSAPEQASAPASPDIDIASTRIATLGGPAVIIEPPITNAKPGRSAVKKRKHARQRAVQRRRVALSARVARQAPQQSADPFAQPANR